ncbi:MAG: phosphatidylglycerophosphatase A, partial [Nevskiales bacterium]|nr:phosphatidylglycerophosphatase A [Nevskiales bacterium]
MHLLAFGLGAGLSPKAPGTLGTLWGVPLWWALSGLGWPVYVVVTTLLFMAGVWICGRSAKRLGVHDSPGIVFDEIVGFLVTATPLLPALDRVSGPAWATLLTAFVLFRFFDIVKPWPIRWLDARVHGGFGIMLDDLAAGVCA